MADNNADLSLKNAKWFAKELGNFSPKEQEALLRTKDFGEFEKILFDKGILNSIGLWQGRFDWRSQLAQGIKIPITSPKAPESKTSAQGAGVASLAGAGLGLILPSKELKYEEFNKTTHKYALGKAEEWEKKQKKKPDLSKYKSKQEAYEAGQRYMHDNIAWYHEPLATKWAAEHGDSKLLNALDRKKIQYEVRNKKWTYQDYRNTVNGYAQRAASDWDKDPFKSVGRQQAYDSAERDIHDTFVRSHLSGKKAKEWAAQYNDPGLNAAIERKRLQDESDAIKNQGRISKALGRNPAAKFAPPVIAQTPTQTPIPANTFPGTLPTNTLRNTGAPTAWTPLQQNTLGGAGAPNVLQGAQAPTTAPKPTGFRGRLSYFGPRSIARRVRGRIMGSKAGQRLASSRMGRLAGKANRLGGMASKATRRIKNALNPLGYLEKLLKKAIGGAAISAVTSVVSTLIAAVTGFTSIVIGAVAGFSIGGVIAGIVAIAGAIPGGIAAVVIGIILIIVLLFTWFFNICWFFCGSPGDPFDASPYPGIAYAIKAPEELPNGQDIKYDILLIHNSAIADYAIEDITLASQIPSGTTFVSATGNYDIPQKGIIEWKLYPENRQPFSEDGTTKGFYFTLVVSPKDDITVTNTLTLRFSGSGPPPSGDITPNDNLCFNNEYAYILNNKILPKNFGDPDCTMDGSDSFSEKNDLYNLLKDKDPQWADFWFGVIIPGESSFHTNSWACGWDASLRRCTWTDDAKGAWGLFQMNSGSPPGSLTQRGGRRGDVTWREQVDNAIGWNKVIDGVGKLFEYWQAAIEYCRDGHFSEPQCRDIKNMRY